VRIATIHGRVAQIDGAGSGAVYVETASRGRFGPESAGVYARWTEIVTWASSTPLPPSEALEPDTLGSPSPNPRQVFAIGLNYSAHAAESGFACPDTSPPVFTKYPSCITGPYTDIELPQGGHTDWEVELVVVIGLAARHVAAAGAWRHVAGLSVGQDVSERRLQMAATPPQFSLGKSYPGSGRWVRG
jgi:2,4-didehydro-3-deoxy-L-rhamnonate hydrolase